MKRLFALLIFLAFSVPATAQWQVPAGAVPVGRGPGVVGFNSASGASGLCLTSTGPTTAPTFQSCVTGPVSSTVGNLALWNNTTGTLLKDGGSTFGTVNGPVSSIVGNVALWNNTTGTLLKDSGSVPGTVTSIAVTPGGGLSVSGSPITTAGTITIGNNIGLVSITDAAYGAKCNGVFIGGTGFGGASNLTINSGSPNLLSTGSTFTSSDVGKSIWVPGAGAAGAGLSTTILTFTDATHVVLAANASTTVTAVAVTLTNPLVYGTDDTVAIQAAMTATPNGGKLIIPAGAPTGGQTSGGCLIKRQGANAYVLIQDHPFSIQGHGHFSNLMTDPSIPTTITNLFVSVGSFDWANTTWENFSIGDYPSFVPSTLTMYTRHGGQGLSLIDTNAGNGFVGVTIRNMSIGESSNDFSIVLGNPGSSNSQFNIIEHNKIWGGVELLNVADSHRIIHNVLQGKSTWGGVFSFVAGAGKFEFSGNNVTWAGGFRLESGNKPAVINNFFEELFSTSESNNAMVDFNGSVGAITMPTFTGNIVNALVSSTSTPIRFGSASNPNFGDNFITTSTSRTGVTSVTTLNCIAPNVWSGVGTHFSTALAQTYGGC